MVEFGEAVGLASDAIDMSGYLGLFSDHAPGDDEPVFAVRPDLADAREELWGGLKLMAAIGASWPGQADIHPDAWLPGTFRGAIDRRIGDIIEVPGNVFPKHYEIAGLYNTRRRDADCVHEPTSDEYVRARYVADVEIEGVDLGNVYQLRVINGATAWSGNFFPANTNADADDIECDNFDAVTRISTDCRAVHGWRAQCMGEPNIAYSWRALSIKNSFVEVVAEIDLAHAGPGRNFAGVMSDADDLGFVFFVNSPTQFRFDDGIENDGLIMVDEAHGLPNDSTPRGYAKQVNALGSGTCQPAHEIHNIGPAVNHHQLRTASFFLNWPICKPTATSCESIWDMMMPIDFLFAL